MVWLTWHIGVQILQLEPNILDIHLLIVLAVDRDGLANVTYLIQTKKFGIHRLVVLVVDSNGLPPWKFGVQILQFRPGNLISIDL